MLTHPHANSILKHISHTKKSLQTFQIDLRYPSVMKKAHTSVASVDEFVSGVTFAMCEGDYGVRGGGSSGQLLSR